MKYTEYKKLDLVEINRAVLEKWRKEGCFQQTLKAREGAKKFVFFEGPPSANGMPGIHHVMARSIKDSICRYKTQMGYLVQRKAGWDTHGLPVELGVEKMLGITKEDIGKTISIKDYNAACRKEVMKYTKEWVNMTERIGYWVDMNEPYITYDNRYIETLWYLLKDIYKKGLLYKGYTIQPYSPAAGTGLSSHELNQPGCYRDVKDTTVTAQFRILDPRPEMTQWGTPYFIAWTTTPWTLPSNTALCVGPNIDYVCVQTYNGYTGEKMSLLVAKSRLNAYLKPEGAELPLEEYKAGDKVVPYRIVAEYKGTDLVGMHYAQLMPWVKPLEKISENSAAFVKAYAEAHADKCFSVGQDRFVELSEEGFRVIPGDYVTTEDGTGIVHIAPTFGADDAKVARDAGIPSLFMINKAGETRPMVDLTGKYYMLTECADEFIKTCVDVEEYKHHEGDYVKNAYAPEFNKDGKYDEAAAAKAEDLNIVICMEMKQSGLAYKIEKHVHNYPHCWRTDKPVLYYPLDSWFIRSTAVKDRMIELNKTIKWKPESTGSGRFGKWLENLNDWNLSRSRYWGTPLPIWRNAETREEICIGSVEELYNEIDKSVAAGFMKSNPLKENGFVPGNFDKDNYEKIDLHRPYVDDIVLVSASGKPMKRETDLIDVWFDSGAMPYAQEGLAHLGQESFGQTADFIAEGVDQTRGWFFTLHAINTMVSDKVAYKAVISNGLVLDKDGNKMSKRKGNAIDPFMALDEHGADALRWYMLTNSQPWDNLKFDMAGVEEVKRKFFGTLYNTYSFFALYANVDGFTGEETLVPVAERPEIDRWVISYLNSLIRNVRAAYENYDVTNAGRMISEFVCDHLSNWYVRLNRKRFWGGRMDQDKLAAYQTLYACLETVSILAAPIAPFFMERLFLDLNAVSKRHAETSVHLVMMPEYNEAYIDKDLEERMELAQKSTSMILALRRKVNIKVRQPLAKLIVPVLDHSLQDQFEQVKQIVLNEVNVKEVEFIYDTTGLITKKIKPNFKTLGKRYGKQMKEISGAFGKFSQQEIVAIEQAGTYRFELPSGSVELQVGDYEISSEDMPGWLVASEGRLTLALDITITDELRKEGIARELVNRIQNLRKDCDFEVTDKVNVVIEDTEEIRGALSEFKEYVAAQTLSNSIELAAAPADAAEIEWNEGTLKVSVKKA